MNSTWNYFKVLLPWCTHRNSVSSYSPICTFKLMVQIYFPSTIWLNLEFRKVLINFCIWNFKTNANDCDQGWFVSNVIDWIQRVKLSRSVVLHCCCPGPVNVWWIRAKNAFISNKCSTNKRFYYVKQGVAWKWFCNVNIHQSIQKTIRTKLRTACFTTTANYMGILCAK